MDVSGKENQNPWSLFIPQNSIPRRHASTTVNHRRIGSNADGFAFGFSFHHQIVSNPRTPSETGSQTSQAKPPKQKKAEKKQEEKRSSNNPDKNPNKQNPNPLPQRKCTKQERENKRARKEDNKSPEQTHIHPPRILIPMHTTFPKPPEK
ncbi:hypothetical protein PRK78_005928 [Emydomyces testavorans]|uniref:Uncharacterized protein n=1 Tax=Emydomyces testavorans TaxID=2070801 RepID=A0AAF0DML1_9EURO|nr:hypothetical protein PRK78_005928 [Emydomyces testavorans]